jgi:hypothetical protein
VKWKFANGGWIIGYTMRCTSAVLAMHQSGPIAPGLKWVRPATWRLVTAGRPEQRGCSGSSSGECWVTIVTQNRILRGVLI